MQPLERFSSSLVVTSCDNMPGRGQGPAGGRLGPWPPQATPAPVPMLPCPPGPGEDPGWVEQ